VSKEDKIRKRLSYSFWRNIASEFKDVKQAEYICNKVFDMMDMRMMFNTNQQAGWDKESLELVLQDI
jgi:hypothetical protein